MKPPVRLSPLPALNRGRTILMVMSASSSKERLEEAGRAARGAEARRDEGAANEAWRRYRLIRDAGRDPDQLLAEGIALSERAIQLAASAR